MSAHSTRRHRTYYWSLPVVVAVVFLLVAQLVAMQRAEIIADLSDRVAHRDSAEASAAVRQLGAMPRPPAAVLVAAATAADRKVASEAQKSIDKLLRRSQQKIEAGRSVKSLARQLAELAAALAENRDSFSAADRSWLVTTTQRILRLANQVPQKHTPLVATHCDLILTSTATTDVARTQNQQPIAETNVPRAETAVAAPSTQVDNQADDSELFDRPSDNQIDAPWRSSWSRPVFRMLPATPAIPPAAIAPPVDASPTTSAPSNPMTQEPPAMLDCPLAEVDTRTLMQKWLATERRGASLPEQKELKQRGFGQLSNELVQQFLSDRPQDRLQFVDDVLTKPGIDARPWLMLLAEDPDADVRLSAVTVMATSTDATLVEKAWQAAIHDRDPRIAELAVRLRERRATTKRR